MRPQPLSLRTGLALLALLWVAALLAWSLPRDAAAGSLFQSPLATKTLEAPRAATPGSGYLPAPTLSAPGNSIDGRSAPLLPGPQPPLAAPTIAPVSRTPTPEGGGDAAGAAQLIDSAVLALSYIWLCCGALALVIAALGSVWLIRRNRRSDPEGT